MHLLPCLLIGCTNKQNNPARPLFFEYTSKLFVYTFVYTSPKLLFVHYITLLQKCI